MKLFKPLIFISSVACAFSAFPADVVWSSDKRPASYSMPANADPVVAVAAGMFADDIKAVTDIRPRAVIPAQANIRLYQLDTAPRNELKMLKEIGMDIDGLKNQTDGFAIKVHNGVIYIAGANGRGVAYGLLEMSRMAGVTPWVWWGDVVPTKNYSLTIDDNFNTMQGASVEHRGVFINDEDWSLRAWSHLNFEPSEKTEIGAKTYRKIFELLLRLRANTIWPAMHEGTTAFFNVPGAKAQADSCGIIVGTSHCEPLLRNNVGEWDRSERGEFNYRTNKAAVQQYWADRLDEVKDSKGGNIFTIGMRGIHDSSMAGYKTMQEKFDGLQEVINDQQKLIDKHIGDPSKQDQIFVPYKEVLELYEMGLDVPDYVTLMWCDDNYGYLTRLSNPEEQKRRGGGGVYYHLSYWGRPHDYLWLTTTQPGLIYQQMRNAYDHNVRKLWIANVHDPKVAGYDLELFMDMAWNIDGVDANSLDSHYKAWLSRNFGEKAADEIFPAMMDFYRLVGQRRPEFMGWSQTECDKRLYERGNTPVRNTEFSTKEFGNELDRYIADYARIARTVDEAAKSVDYKLHDAYYAAVVYPVCAASAHARALLEAQKARELASGRNSITNRAEVEDKIMEASAASQNAYLELRRLTEYYNDVIADGKWRGLMDMRPRDLPAFYAPTLPVVLSQRELSAFTNDTPLEAPAPVMGNVVSRKAADFNSVDGQATPMSMLGHSMKAVELKKGAALRYDFNVAGDADGVIRVAVIPNHAVDGNDIRYSVSIDGGEAQVFNIREPFRSEQWKLNVLRGQNVRTVPAKLNAGRHTLEIKALDDNIVIDQWMWDDKPGRKFYLFPSAD